MNMKKKILVLGRTGMLGHMVLAVLSKSDDFFVRGTQFTDPEEEFYFDAANEIRVLKEIYDKNQGFDYLVNCIGALNRTINLNNKYSIAKAIRINSLFPYGLAEFAEENNIKVIHISTDGVFLGSREYYTEGSLSDCTDIYGKTKSLGEVNSKNVINIRCSILGRSPFEKGGLLEWFLSRKEGAVIEGYTNDIWNGVTTLQFAELCENIINGNEFDSLRKLSSVFHFAPNQAISKYELLVLLRSVFAKDISVNPIEDSKGKIYRILRSNYCEALKKVYPRDIPMRKAVDQLVDFEKNDQ